MRQGDCPGRDRDIVSTGLVPRSLVLVSRLGCVFATVRYPLPFRLAFPPVPTGTFRDGQIPVLPRTSPRLEFPVYRRKGTPSVPVRDSRVRRVTFGTGRVGRVDLTLSLRSGSRDSGTGPGTGEGRGGTRVTRTGGGRIHRYFTGRREGGGV